jgi:PAS domain S-box-containing protein
MNANSSSLRERIFPRDALTAPQLELWYRFLDLTLVVTAILLAFTDATVMLFHVTFILLTIGAFFWKLRPFVIRAVICVAFASVIVLNAILTRETPIDELMEIPLLTIILLVVFAVARQRAQAEDALRKSNDELETRVAERTIELTQVNAELINEIAQHKQTTDTLRESEERYRRLVEVAFEAIAIRCEGKIVYINPAGAKLLGANNPGELIGRPFLDFVHPDYWEIVHTRAQGAQEDGLGQPLTEEKLISLDGNTVEVEVAGIPVAYEGRPAVQIVIHDLTARKRAERERQKERERIARDLHDSLGHSLGFLHLKLDQLAYGEDLGDVQRLRQDVAQMRDVANQAYEIVRGMLATLHPSNVGSLTETLLALARAAGQKAHFTVQFSSEGLPSALHPIVQQQTLYIFQEALNNITRHANAERVDINLCWTEEALTAVISDNGCGFDVADQHSDGHYGLSIMQERTEEINGQLLLTSGPGCGTQITLRLPLQRP